MASLSHRLPETSLKCVIVIELLFVLVLLPFLLCANSVLGSEDGGFGKVVLKKTLHVDPTGQQGDFTTIQSAIDSVPRNNKGWVCIFIAVGIYREKVIIPSDKPYIILKGRGKSKTEVVWDDHETVIQSPTFTSSADYTVVESMGFRNSYNNPPNGNSRVPAVAAMISGDKSYFRWVGFWGLQDTLWDDKGRHYYMHCTIQGAVDFIFGSGQSIYEDCSISVLGAALEPGQPGFITAQGRSDPRDSNGFVFINCNVFGNGSAFLGRPWRGYARVLFYHSRLTSVVQPRGWDAWDFVGSENRLTFAEYGCYGTGADTSKRVPWLVKPTQSLLEQLASLDFIDSDGWLSALPF